MSWNIVFIIILVVGFSFLFQLWLNKLYLKNLRKQIRMEYGKKPDNGPLDPEDKSSISRYHSLIQNVLSEDELVDEITWNDLEMDIVFQRMNCTNSFIGEQMLYSELHRLPKNKDNLYLREKIIQFYNDNPKEREDTQVLLRHLKKSAVNNYIVDFMDTLDVQTSPFFKLCRILQCTLFLLIIGALATLNAVVIGAAFANFLINLTIYALSKTKYEVVFSSLYGIIRTIKTADILNNSPVATIVNEKNSNKKLSKINTRLVALERKKQASLAGDLNGILYDYLIGASLWDFTVYDKVIHLLLKNKEAYMQLYRFIGEIDLSITIGFFR